jgi:hypothetical protein
MLLPACDFLGGSALGGGYRLEEATQAHRYITKEDSNGSQIVIDSQIVGTRRRGNYILVRRFRSLIYECHLPAGAQMIITHYTDDEQWWIIDLSEDVLHGPLDFEQFNEKGNELRIRNMAVPLQVRYWPNTDEFEVRTSECVQLERISY